TTTRVTATVTMTATSAPAAPGAESCSTNVVATPVPTSSGPATTPAARRTRPTGWSIEVSVSEVARRVEPVLAPLTTANATARTTRATVTAAGLLPSVGVQVQQAQLRGVHRDRVTVVVQHSTTEVVVVAVLGVGARAGVDAQRRARRQDVAFADDEAVDHRVLEDVAADVDGAVGGVDQLDVLAVLRGEVVTRGVAEHVVDLDPVGLREGVAALEQAHHLGREVGEIGRASGRERG